MEPSPDEDAHDYVPPAAPVETGTSGEDLAAAGMPRHISPHSLPHAAITPLLPTPKYRCATPRSSPGMLTRAPPSTRNRPRGNLDRHGVHYPNAYVTGD